VVEGTLPAPTPCHDAVLESVTVDHATGDTTTVTR
jgi:hypothetical protein